MSRIATALADFQSLDALATRATPLSALDPRAKIVATLAFILTVVSFERYAVAAMLPLVLFPLILAELGGISLRLIGRTLLLAAPFAVFMGALNPWFDQQPILLLWGHVVTGGWLSFVSILLRFGLTVSAGLILIAGTGFYPICAGLRALGVPQVLITQLLLLHRYALVLGTEAARMSLARALRANGRAMPLAVYASLLGHLLLRAVQRSERIHQAMLARGFTGAMPRPPSLCWKRRDTLFVLLCGTVFWLVRRYDVVNWLGLQVLRRLA